MKYKKLSKTARIDEPAHEGDAGCDLYADEEVTLFNGMLAVVSTNIAVAIPKGFVGFIKEKSGLALKQGIQVMGGVIDSGYRGEVCVIVRKNKVEFYEDDDESYTVEKGSKIAQLVIIPYVAPTIEEVERFDETDRGDDGFGSTGLISKKEYEK